MLMPGRLSFTCLVGYECLLFSRRTFEKAPVYNITSILASGNGVVSIICQFFIFLQGKRLVILLRLHVIACGLCICTRSKPRATPCFIFECLIIIKISILLDSLILLFDLVGFLVYKTRHLCSDLLICHFLFCLLLTNTLICCWRECIDYIFHWHFLFDMVCLVAMLSQRGEGIL